MRCLFPYEELYDIRSKGVRFHIYYFFVHVTV